MRLAVQNLLRTCSPTEAEELPIPLPDFNSNYNVSCARTVFLTHRRYIQCKLSRSLGLRTAFVQLLRHPCNKLSQKRTPLHLQQSEPKTAGMLAVTSPYPVFSHMSKTCWSTGYRAQVCDKKEIQREGRWESTLTATCWSLHLALYTDPLEPRPNK